MPRDKQSGKLDIFIVLSIAIALFAIPIGLYINFKPSRHTINTSTSSLSREINDLVELQSDAPGYDIIKTSDFSGYLTFLDTIGFWKENAVVHSSGVGVTTATHVRIVYTLVPQQGAPYIPNVKGNADVLVSFRYQMQDGNATFLIHVDPKVAEKTGFNPQKEFTKTLLLASYLAVKHNFTNSLEEFRQAGTMVDSQYRVPYVEIVKKKESSFNNLLKFLVPNAYAQSCDKWSCGTPSGYCDNQALTCRFNSDCTICDVYGCNGSCIMDSCGLPKFSEEGAIGQTFCSEGCPPGTCVTDVSCTCVAPTSTPMPPPPPPPLPTVTPPGGSTLTPTRTPTPTPTPSPIAGLPWIQAAAGDVYAKGKLQSYIPLAANPNYFNLRVLPSNAGVVLAKNYFFWPGFPNPSHVSEEKWIVKVLPRNEVHYFDLFYNRFGQPTTNDNFLFSIANAQKPVSPLKPFYYVDTTAIAGNTFHVGSGGWSVGANEKIIMLINGNLQIDGPTSVAPGGFLAFIVNGDITVSSQVGVPYNSISPVVDGIYIAANTAHTAAFKTGSSTQSGKERFVGRGMFIADTFVFERNLASVDHNIDTSAEYFIYWPTYLFTMPDIMRELPLTWEEVAP